MGFTLHNLILKSPPLSRSKVLLIEQAAKLSSFRQTSQSSHVDYQHESGFSNRASSLSAVSKFASRKLGGDWSLVGPYARDISTIKILNYDYPHDMVFRRNLSSFDKGEENDRLSNSSIQNDNQSTRAKVQNLITNSKKRVFVFMKGVPKEPACGYSNAVIQILDAYGVDYDSFNVLSDDEIRQEVKAYSNWPTIPQVFVDGSFVGGCDILIQMHQNNELESLFSGKSPDDGDKQQK